MIAAPVPQLAPATAGLLATLPVSASEIAASRSIEVVLALMTAATVLAVVARRLAVPYPVLLVIGGLAIGFIPGLPTVELEPGVVFVLFHRMDPLGMLRAA